MEMQNGLPWLQGPSLFNFIKEHLTPQGFFTLKNLPDTAPDSLSAGMFPLPGMKDLYLLDDEAEAGDSGEALYLNIYQALQSYKKKPSAEAALSLYQRVTHAPCILYYDKLSRRVTHLRYSPSLWKLTKTWLYQATDREAVKFAVIAAGAFLKNKRGKPEAEALKQDLLLLARCEEFTKFVLQALEDSGSLDQDDLRVLLLHTTGWGRVCAIKHFRFTTRASQEWLLMKGLKLTVHDPSLPLWVLEHLDLEKFLDEESLSHPLFLGITRLLADYFQYLLECIQEDLLPQENKVDLFTLLPKYFSQAADHYLDIAVASSLVAMAAAIQYMLQKKFYFALSSIQCQILLDSLNALLSSVDWWPKILAALLTPEGEANLPVIEMAAILDIDIQPELWRLLKNQPSLTTLYRPLLWQANDQDVKDVLAFARLHLDDYLKGKGQLADMLHPLEYFPGQGEDLLERSLTSGSSANRSDALDVLESWSDGQTPLSDKMRQTLSKVRGLSNTPLNQLRIDSLLQGKELNLEGVRKALESGCTT